MAGFDTQVPQDQVGRPTYEQLVALQQQQNRDEMIQTTVVLAVVLALLILSYWAWNRWKPAK